MSTKMVAQRREAWCCCGSDCIEKHVADNEKTRKPAGNAASKRNSIGNYCRLHVYLKRISCNIRTLRFQLKSEPPPPPPPDG